MQKLQSGRSGRDLASHVADTITELTSSSSDYRLLFFLLPLPVASVCTEPTRPALGSAGSGSPAEEAAALRDLSHSELLSTFPGAHTVLIHVGSVN